jgi:lipopolysaccharide exporter
LRGGIFWSLVTFVAARSVTFVSTLVLARLVGPSEFGVLAAVLAFISLLELLSDLGMRATVVYESEHGVTPRVETAFTLNLIVAVVLTLVAVALAPLAAQFFKVPSEAGLFRIASLDILLTAFGNVHDSLLVREMAFRRRTLPQLGSNVVRAAVTIVLVALGMGAAGLVIGFLTGTATSAAALWIVTAYRPAFTIERSAVRSMLSYGGWASVLQVLAVIGNRADVAIIGRMLGQRALGIYVIGQRLPELVIENVSWNLSIVAFPALARRRTAADGGMVPTTLRLIRYSALFGLPVGIGLAVLAQPLVVVLFGEKWAAAGGVMSAVALMYGCHTIVFPLGDVFKALGRQSVMVAINAVSIPAMIVAMVLAAPSGLLAAVWAEVGVAFAQGILLMVLVLRTLHVRLGVVGRELRAAVAAGVGVAVGAGSVRLLWPEESLGPLLLGSIAAAVVGTVMLRTFARSEYNELLELAQRRVLRRTFLPRRWRRVPATADQHATKNSA